jgi:hypothetical protein
MRACSLPFASAQYTDAPSGAHPISEPSPIVVQSFFLMFQMPTWRRFPASVIATKCPSCESSGCWTTAPSK